MKLIFVIVAACLATASAFSAESTEYITNSFADEMSEIANRTIGDLKALVEEMAGSNQVVVWEKTEASKSECIKIAVNATIDLADDLIRAVKQLIIEALELIETFKKCRKLSIKDGKRACYTALGKKTVAYVDEALTTIDKILASEKRAEQIIKEASECLKSAKPEAIAST